MPSPAYCAPVLAALLCRGRAGASLEPDPAEPAISEVETNLLAKPPLDRMPKQVIRRRVAL
jgi:hypothetical protein